MVPAQTRRPALALEGVSASSVERGATQGAVLAPVLANCPWRTQGQPQPVLHGEQEVAIRDDRDRQILPNDGGLQVATGTGSARGPEIHLVVGG